MVEILETSKAIKNVILGRSNGRSKLLISLFFQNGRNKLFDVVVK